MSGGLVTTDEDVLEPPISDVGGYSITARDLEFLQISVEMVQRWRDRRAPLGMDDQDFDYFVRTLRRALELDDIPPDDIRLRGSSTAFFSHPKKRMPWQRDDLLDFFEEATGEYPEMFVLERIERTLRRCWPDPKARPTQVPFDASFRLNIGLLPSDYDIQVCSDEVDARARALVTRLGTSPEPHRINNAEYNYIKKHLVKQACPHLELWAARCSQVLRRGVTIAAFPSIGPPDEAATNGDDPTYLRFAGWQLLGGT